MKVIITNPDKKPSKVFVIKNKQSNTKENEK